MTPPPGSSNDADEVTGVLRIGELSRRTGVKDHQLRSWESRYGLITPQRSEGGFRLYSLADERRVITMKELVEQGLSPAQAARVALSPPATQQWTQSLQLAQLAMSLPADAPSALSPQTAPPQSSPAQTEASPAALAQNSSTASAQPLSALTQPSPILGGVAALLDPATLNPSTLDPAALDAAAGVDTPAPAGGPQAPGSGPSSAPLDLVHQERDSILQALAEFNDEAAHAALDRLLANVSTETVLRQVVIPMLGTIGDRWASSQLTIAQEHFAASWVRGRLNGLARGWATASGPIAVVASPEGELHDLGGMVFGIALHRHGWRVIHLGANTPIAAMGLGGDPHPDLVMCSALNSTPLEIGRRSLCELAATTRVVLGGAGANPMLASETGCHYLPDDPVTAAARVARGDFGDAPQ